MKGFFKLSTGLMVFYMGLTFPNVFFAIFVVQREVKKMFYKNAVASVVYKCMLRVPKGIDIHRKCEVVLFINGSGHAAVVDWKTELGGPYAPSSMEVLDFIDAINAALRRPVTSYIAYSGIPSDGYTRNRVKLQGALKHMETWYLLGGPNV